MINTLFQLLSATAEGGQGAGKWKKMASLGIDWAINHCPFSINHGRWQELVGNDTLCMMGIRHWEGKRSLLHTPYPVEECHFHCTCFSAPHDSYLPVKQTCKSFQEPWKIPCIPSVTVICPSSNGSVSHQLTKAGPINACSMCSECHPLERRCIR